MDEFNWKYIKDFHPMGKENIDRLYFLEAANLEEFIKAINTKNHSFTAKQLLDNNIWISRLKKILK